MAVDFRLLSLRVFVRVLPGQVGVAYGGILPTIGGIFNVLNQRLVDGTSKCSRYHPSVCEVSRAFEL